MYSDNTLSDETCSEHHNGYVEFGEKVRSGIERAFDNSFDFSMKQSSSNRVEMFQRWITRIFDIWYIDVTEAGPNSDRRPCLTDNFPYDSPGNLDKDSVLKSMP